MKNRNTIVFIVLSTLLLGGHNFYISHFSQPKTSLPNANIEEAVTQTYINSVKDPSISAPNGESVLPTKSTDWFTFGNQTIELTWNKSNGALTQVLWSDGTNFFPEYKGDIKSSDRFPGLGVSFDASFDGDPKVSSGINTYNITFKNDCGDSLVYTIPHQGHIVDVEWISSNRHSLNLIPKPSTLTAVKGLGRVFAIHLDSISAISWGSILKDPFFSFIGLKRKELPSATRCVGMDSGIDSGKPNQATHYFAAIWETSRDLQFSVGVRSGYMLTPDETGKVHARLYLGPKQDELLTAFSASGNPKDGEMFKRVVDFGFFGLVAKLLFTILHAIHHVVPNWGWAIVLLTVVIRGVLWPLNTKTTVQMLRMKELEPFQKLLQTKYEKFGNDLNKKAEMQKELMAFYKKNGHNPMGGCLPTLFQMPVFFALWSMLSAVFELRHAPFLGWLMDLSSSDPYYILPVMMGVSMVVQQMIAPAVGDPNQRKIMMIIMPIMFSFFFANTPSGLCLYYLMFNIIGIFQTWLIIKSYKPQPVNM